MSHNITCLQEDTGEKRKVSPADSGMYSTSSWCPGGADSTLLPPSTAPYNRADLTAPYRAGDLTDHSAVTEEQQLSDHSSTAEEEGAD